MNDERSDKPVAGPLADAMRSELRNRAEAAAQEQAETGELRRRQEEAARMLRPAAERLSSALSARGIRPDLVVELVERRPERRFFLWDTNRLVTSTTVLAKGWLFEGDYSEWQDSDSQSIRVVRKLTGFLLETSGKLAMIHNDNAAKTPGGFTVAFDDASAWQGDVLNGPIPDRSLATYQQRLLSGLAGLAVQHGVPPDEIT